jgi:hypothetical protein
LTLNFVISSLIVGTFKSVCNTLLDIYHGAFTVARRTFILIFLWYFNVWITSCTVCPDRWSRRKFRGFPHSEKRFVPFILLVKLKRKTHTPNFGLYYLWTYVNAVAWLLRLFSHLVLLSLVAIFPLKTCSYISWKLTFKAPCGSWNNSTVCLY